jgi:protocatechuate 3,4-dioxygenase beta subunit
MNYTQECMQVEWSVIMKWQQYFVILFLGLLTACSGTNSGADTAVSPTPPSTTEPEMTPEPTIAEPATAALPTITNEPETVTVEATLEAVEESVQPLSPAEQLIASFTQPSQTNGDVLVLVGQVLDVNGSPVPNAVVEIWQTDSSGVYDHPDDPGTNGRDTAFQFFGTATVDAEGWYAFRTIVPGRYEPRPRHIHFKVKQNESTLLTSQFYFSDDIAEVAGEGMFQAVGESGDLLLLQLVQGDGMLLVNGRIVVDTGIGSGTLPLTPSQAEGPYYPVVSLDAYDNDLAICETCN